MNYRFSDFHQDSVYDKSGVIFVCGRYPVFNSLVIDKARDSTRKNINIDLNAISDIMNEFAPTTDSSDDGLTGQSINFNEFVNYVRTPAILGRWFCSTEFKSLTKKDKDRLWTYIKKPNLNGLLVINVTDFKDAMTIRKNSVVQRSQYIALFQLNYPPRVELANIVINMFAKHDIQIDNKTSNYFIMRMSEYYDDYESKVNEVAIDAGRTKIITFDRMKSLLKDTENYMFDDFIMRLTKPIPLDPKKEWEYTEKEKNELINEQIKKDDIKEKRNRIKVPVKSSNIKVEIKKETEEEKKEVQQAIENDKRDRAIKKIFKPKNLMLTESRRKVNKMLVSILENMTPRQVVYKLSKRIDQLIDYRVLINDGYIPVMVRYSADAVKDDLDEKSKLKNVPNITFKKSAYLASMTSLKDWYIMKMLLTNINNKRDDNEYLRVLLAVIYRRALPKERLLNDLKINDTFDEELYEINSCQYDEDFEYYLEHRDEYLDELRNIVGGKKIENGESKTESKTA